MPASVPPVRAQGGAGVLADDMNLVRAALLELQTLLTSPTDGQTIQYSTTLGKWQAVNPSGAQRLAAGSNVTGFPTAASASSGVGTGVDVPGTTISVPASGGLPVVFRWAATAQQTVAGDGVTVFALWDVTAGASLTATFQRLPNTAAAPACYQSLTGEFDFGVISAPRTFKLQWGLWSPSGSAPSSNLMNAGNNPTFLRATAGA